MEGRVLPDCTYCVGSFHVPLACFPVVTATTATELLRHGRRRKERDRRKVLEPSESFSIREKDEEEDRDGKRFLVNIKARVNMVYHKS